MLPNDLESRVRARVGTVLKGKYRLDSILGIGGMAAVYAATHRNTKRVAIKILHPQWSSNFTARAYFQREGPAANIVTHRGVVQIDDDDVTDDGTYFIVMELLEGLGVEELRIRHGGRLSVDATVSIAGQMLDVLSAAHERTIVHRDIKPSNLFLLRDGFLKVLDFGIARIRDAARFGVQPLATSADPLGTPGFMAPEQVLGKFDLDARTDVWGASATVFMLLSGTLAHDGRTPEELRICAGRDAANRLEKVAPQVPVSIAAVVNRGLAVRREDRWASALDMRTALLDAHRAEFGRPPELQTEERWEPPLSRAVGSVEPTSIVVDESISKSTSDQPLSITAVSKRLSPILPMGPALAIAMLLLTAFGFFRASPSTTSSASRPAVAPALPEVPAVSSMGKPRRERSLPMLTAPLETVDSGPELRPPPARPIVVPAAFSQPHDCDPPTSVDSAGIKRPKPWCL